MHYPGQRVTILDIAINHSRKLVHKMGTIQRAASELQPGMRVHIGHDTSSTWRTVATVKPHPKYSAIAVVVTWRETPGAAPDTLVARDIFELEAGSVRVRGAANIGDVVTYHDIANQDGARLEVISTPEENTDPKWGWTKGYGLFSEAQGITYSDLRQHGWTFAGGDEPGLSGK